MLSRSNTHHRHLTSRHVFEDCSPSTSERARSRRSNRLQHVLLDEASTSNGLTIFCVQYVQSRKTILEIEFIHLNKSAVVTATNLFCDTNIHGKRVHGCRLLTSYSGSIYRTFLPPLTSLRALSQRCAYPCPQPFPLRPRYAQLRFS